MLEKYKRKRSFAKTPEPPGSKAKNSKAKTHKNLGLAFVVQKHQASHLHYDFRLEHNGVLLSWAVPKGPSMNPQDKRLAMMVENHPFEYRKFAGVIPAGNYGAGTVEIWDEGDYAAVGASTRQENERLVGSGVHKGHLTFVLNGKKLKGEFALIKTGGRGNSSRAENSWLLVKADDQFANSVAQNSAENLPKTKKIKMPAGKISPMLAKLADQPFDGEDWIFEIKWDGYRTIARVDQKNAQLISRNNISFTELYAPVASTLKNLGHQAILDGEVVILDRHGAADFQLLQNYNNDKTGQPTYCIFDILYLDGRDLRNCKLLERKKILAKLVSELHGKLKGAEKNRIKFSDHIEGKGKAFFKATKAQQLEGIMAKKKNSKYTEGKRTDNWLKIKTHLRQEAVIGGFTAPRGSRKDFGALILGVYESGRLKYIGHTGGGFNQKSLPEVYGQLSKLTRSSSPFADKFSVNSKPTWVQPKLVCEVEFREWTQGGHMRQPIFVGLRFDKNPKEVVKEKALKTKANAKT